MSALSVKLCLLWLSAVVAWAQVASKPIDPPSRAIINMAATASTTATISVTLSLTPYIDPGVFSVDDTVLDREIQAPKRDYSRSLVEALSRAPEAPRWVTAYRPSDKVRVYLVLPSPDGSDDV